jgi:hypothetical protein
MDFRPLAEMERRQHEAALRGNTGGDLVILCDYSGVISLLVGETLGQSIVLQQD